MKPIVSPRRCPDCDHSIVWDDENGFWVHLNAIADKVLAHKPKPKSKPARKRARRAKKIAQTVDV